VKLSRVAVRSLLHYWKTAAVVAFGVAVATTVIIGSLLVGASVNGSIRDAALSRLGSIDHALTSPRFIREELAGTERLQRIARLVVPAIIMQGALRNPDSGASLPRMNVVAVDDDFWGFYPGVTPPPLAGRHVAVNHTLARDLGVAEGGSLLLTVARQGAAPSNTLFAQRDREYTDCTTRLEVAAVLPDAGPGTFALRAGTGTPRNVFVSRKWLTEQIGQPGSANALLVNTSSANTAELQSAFDSACTLDDLGLKLVVDEKSSYLSLQSRALLLNPREVQVALDTATACGANAMRTSVYLADRIVREGSGKPGTSYAVVAGIEPPDGQTSGDFILLNPWASADVEAQVRDRIAVSYPVPSPDGTYTTKTLALTLRGEIDLMDPGLVPEFEGITDADAISKWHPPFPIDQKRVTWRDEAYWQKYRAAPKAFVSIDTVRAMWSESGTDRWVTGVQVMPPQGEELAALKDRFSQEFLGRFRAEDAGLVWRPVRALAMAASKGSTDFGVLFVSMSSFIVLAGAALAGMLMRLSVERRTAETGILLAAGFRMPDIRRVLFAECAVLAVAGALAGVPLGMLYAAGIMHGLRTWWTGAVGTSALWLHVDTPALAGGLACGLATGLAAIWWGAHKLLRRPVLELLSGEQPMPASPAAGQSRKLMLRAFVAALAAAALLFVLSLAHAIPTVPAFFGTGAALLGAGLAGSALLLFRRAGPHGRRAPLLWLAARNAGANRGRSMLAIALLACATFVIVTVAANERDFSQSDVTDQWSGTGGFSLRAVSSLPVHYDFGTPAGRAKLAFAPEDEPAWQDVKVFSFLLSSGDDISCLNLARPAAPRVLGVDDAMIDRNGFSVQVDTDDRGWNPWLLLKAPRKDGEVVGFGDSASVQWQLHKGLGDTVNVPDEAGRPVAVRMAGLLSGSILASELLVSNDNFRSMFPTEAAPRFFLIETPPGQAEAVAASLRRNLGDAGVEVRETREILNDLIGVQNTYLMTFLALGGLGLLMGTVGLVVVLLRNALERRREFALMLATGFKRRHLAALLVVENTGLLVVGLVCGAVAALVAVAPQLASVNSRVNWAGLVALVAGIIVVGLGSCVVAAASAVRGRSLDALRAE